MWIARLWIRNTASRFTFCAGISRRSAPWHPELSRLHAGAATTTAAAAATAAATTTAATSAPGLSTLHGHIPVTGMTSTYPLQVQ